MQIRNWNSFSGMFWARNFPHVAKPYIRYRIANYRGNRVQVQFIYATSQFFINVIKALSEALQNIAEKKQIGCEHFCYAGHGNEASKTFSGIIISTGY